MSRGISRRAVVTSAALIPVTTLRSVAASTATVFSPAQRRTLDAFIDRLVPEDENGPSGTACGAANYIDRSLAEFLAAEKASFLAGLDQLDADSRRAHGTAFADLSSDKQDQVLKALESSSRAFFDRVRRLTLEGMMSDPHYGGNTNYSGWDLIRYPGPRLAVSAEDQELDRAAKPVRASAYGHGH